jgi:SET domain-containing protein
MTILVPTRVSASTISGLGLFTTVPIEKGALIWRMGPEDLTFTLQQANALLTVLDSKKASDEFYRFAYVDEDLDVVVLHMDDMRFMNHSSTPNTISTALEMRAARYIAAGEELSDNYLSYAPNYGCSTCLCISP